jgi:hypothetical protein
MSVSSSNVPPAHHAANWGALGGLGVMIFGAVVPPLAVAGFLVALVSVVAMLVQFPARLRRHRQALPMPAARPLDAPSRPSWELGEHSPDYDPDVVHTNPLAGLGAMSTWSCVCGQSSLGCYLDPANARRGFLAHKYGLPWPSNTTTG